MDLSKIIITSLIISPSGALSPGPLTASAIAWGASSQSGIRGLFSGLKVAIGHMIFELPYVVILSYMISLIPEQFFMPLTIISLTFIAYFSYLLISDGLSRVRGLSSYTLSDKVLETLGPILTGIILTGANPYFLMWWVTVGLELVRTASYYGLLSFFIMYLSHIWMDFLWLGLMGLAGGGASNFLSSKAYGYFLIGLGIALLLFGINMVIKIF